MKNEYIDNKNKERRKMVPSVRQAIGAPQMARCSVYVIFKTKSSHSILPPHICKADIERNLAKLID